MSLRYPTYGGLVWWNHMKKEVHLKRPLNPPSHNARFVSEIRKGYDEYTIVEDWKTK